MIKNLKIVMLTAILIFAALKRSEGQTQFLNGHSAEITKNNIGISIDEVIASINQDSIKSYISLLQNFQTRFELNDNRELVSDWIYKKFQSFGYSDVSLDEFSAFIGYNHIDKDYLQRNVICELPGHGEPDETFILCAHYDSFNQFGDPMVEAPGADDNASGTAALIEIARVLKFKNIIPKRTLVFAALAGEELMNTSFSGSKYFAEKLDSLNENVKLVSNYDMIGYTDKILSRSIVNINHHSSSIRFADLAKISFQNYSNISANPTSYWGADLGPFVDKGFPGIYFEENYFNPYYHSVNDKLENIDIAYCSEVIKGSCATILWASSMPNLINNINAKIETLTVRFSWDSNNDFDFASYVLYISLDGGSTFKETLTTDTTVSVGGLNNYTNLKYAVAARSTDGYESFATIFDLNLTHTNDPFDNSKLDFSLDQNYPNPFNPNTTIKYSMPENGLVRIIIFDVLGNEIAKLVNENKTKGKHQIEFNAGNLSSGIYFYRLSFGKYSDSKKMIILK